MDHDKRAETYVKACLESLKKKGFRITQTRKTAIDSIVQIKTSFTVKELHSFIELHKKEKFDFATLFRIISTLQKIGLVHQNLQTNSFFPCYHVSCEDFIHVINICRICKNTEECHLTKKLDLEMFQALEKSKSFESENAILHIFGLCSNCNS